MQTRGLGAISSHLDNLQSATGIRHRLNELLSVADTCERSLARAAQGSEIGSVRCAENSLKRCTIRRVCLFEELEDAAAVVVQDHDSQLGWRGTVAQKSVGVMEKCDIAHECYRWYAA